MNPVAEGDPAPDFKLPTDGGGTFSLAAHKGRPVVLYFYPKDDTSGCTTEALDFTAAKEEFDRLGVVVAGMSPDAVSRHDRFRDKHALAVTLISDELTETMQAYGVWTEKSMYGRKFMGVVRSTFLIDADGRIARVWRKVSVRGHVEQVLEAARALAG